MIFQELNLVSGHTVRNNNVWWSRWKRWL